MKFGSKEVFDTVSVMIADPDSAGRYEELYAIIRADTLSAIGRDTLSQEEREDIIQNVELAVFRALVRYAENYADATPEERNSYLRRIIANKRNDCLAEQYRARQFVSYDADNSPEYSDNCIMEESLMNGEQVKQELFQSIRGVCALRTTPDKIIAFLHNKVAAAEDRGGHNGSPAEVSRKLSEFTQQAAADMAVSRLEKLLQCRIPKSVFAPLYDKLRETTSEGIRAELPFRLSARDITDSSCWIASKMRKQRSTNIGGNTYDSPSHE